MFIYCAMLCATCFAKEQARQVQAQNSTEADQQISDFSLSGFGDKGKKAWDLSGKSADIFNDVIKLKDLVGNLYGDKEDVKLTADTGDFDKGNGKIHVERNVVITTSGGAKLTTDSLDWDRVNQVVSTKDVVNIKRENMATTARGALGEPSLNKMKLEKEVKVEIEPENKADKIDSPKEQSKIIITCDGPLDIDYAKNVATFHNNVKVDRGDSQIYSDLMEVYFGSNKGEKAESDKAPSLMGSKIDKIIARGNVKTVRGENITYSDEAVYNGADKKITLSGRPRLIIYSTEDFKGSM